MAQFLALALKFHVALCDGAEANKVYKKYQKSILGGEDTKTTKFETRTISNMLS